MTTSHRLIPRAALAAVAALAVVAPVASAAVDPATGLDASIYDTGVPAGQVEHGVSTYTITGSRDARDQRVEYWNSATKWREQTTDVKTGQVVNARYFDGTTVTWVNVKAIPGQPKIETFKGHDSVPGPGFPAAYNRILVQTGLIPQPGADDPITETLQPIGPRTVAGVAGTAYHIVIDRPAHPVTDGRDQTLVLENGTFRPLLREITAPNGARGTFDQREELVSRELVSEAAAAPQLSAKSFKKSARVWTKAWAAAKKHHKK